MQPVFLHLDDALAAQSRLMARGQSLGVLDIDGRLLGPQLRLWSKDATLELLGALLDQQLPAAHGRALVFAGSGDFHHVSALLIQRATAISNRPLTVIHIDNHPDWVRFGRGLHCGSWVARAARLPDVARLITLGVCSTDMLRPSLKGADLALITEGHVELYPWQGRRGRDSFTVSGVARPTMQALGEGGFLAHLLGRITTQDVYITIDKDVLATADAATNWDQGQMTLGYLSRLIDAIGAAHHIAGADVVGDWSQPVYGGSTWTRLQKRAEAFIDQPHRHPHAMHAMMTNERVNLALLNRLMAAAA